MFHELVADAGELTPEELHAHYAAELAAIVDEHGVETVAEQSGVDAATVEALRESEAPDLTLEEAAAVLAVRDGTPDAGTVAASSRDALLLGMTSAVLDVEALSSGIDGELEPREIQSKVEGRFPITLREFALVHQFIQSRIA